MCHHTGNKEMSVILSVETNIILAKMPSLTFSARYQFSAVQRTMHNFGNRNFTKGPVKAVHFLSEPLCCLHKSWIGNKTFDFILQINFLNCRFSNAPLTLRMCAHRSRRRCVTRCSRTGLRWTVTIFCPHVAAL